MCSSDLEGERGECRVVREGQLHTLLISAWDLSDVATEAELAELALIQSPCPDWQGSPEALGDGEKSLLPLKKDGGAVLFTLSPWTEQTNDRKLLDPRLL